VWGWRGGEGAALVGRGGACGGERRLASDGKGKQEGLLRGHWSVVSGHSQLFKAELGRLLSRKGTIVNNGPA
jgi:hypothetical protein